MICCGRECYGSEIHTIFVIGDKENKINFFKNVLDIEYKTDPFFEKKIVYNSVELLVLSCEVGDNLEDIMNLHSKASCAIVLLSNVDVPLVYDKFTLFVLMNKKSVQITDNHLVVASVINEDWNDCKEGFGTLVRYITTH